MPTEESKPVVVTETVINEPIVAEITQVQNEVVAPIITEIPKPSLPNFNPTGTKVSALSLASVKAKKDLEAQQNQYQKHKEELPSEVFNETDMLLQWNKFAQKMTDAGKRLLATYMQMNDPTLNGTTITLELPNQSTKEEFLTGCHELIGYLRGKLHNHDITIEVIVNEATENKYAFTPQEKFERLKQINPTIELLRKTFDLDV
ncbi:DNA polymerase III subunit gamma/tau [Flavobacterium sp. LMO9]|nr:DNA polymerase III subunit gamma/tau [Flavobacterium sp. LMO9]MQP62386.1 DNA polymerase III subunit gamma/tau [Flavobacterium sp. LMO6]